MIARGFVPVEEGKTIISSTKDKALLKGSVLKNKFNEDKYKITNYIKTLGPPKKKPADLSN